ncbi:cytoplasmic protein [Prolixibacter sp. NT017]|uniref:cytoplasmic protein n=1 Tax=Prolixibacter sp. NT017 TaxID=2652390 RepID=UPI0012825219|nr:cytoplasmic protein [Prolixibacter sp. NT017]GET24601.1 hypothetical protein NT017_09300 [Prolixibacter sp. NT017]
MNDLIPVKVECYSGYKADEYPICFYWGNICFDIKEILDRWYQTDSHAEWPAANYFKVETLNGQYFLLKHEMKPDHWYLVVKGESMNLQA